MTYHLLQPLAKGALCLCACALIAAACQGPNAEVAAPPATLDDAETTLLVADKPRQPAPAPIPEPFTLYLRPPYALPSHADTLVRAVALAADSLMRLPASHPHAISAWNRLAQQVDSVALAPYSALDFLPLHLERVYQRDPQALLRWIYEHPRLADNRLATLLPAIDTLSIEQMKRDVDRISDSLVRRTLYAILPIDIYLSINAAENDLDFYRQAFRRIEQLADHDTALTDFNTLVVKWNMDESINLLTCTLYDDFCNLTRRLYLRNPQAYLLWIYNHRNTLEFAHRDHLSDMLLAAAQSTRRLSLHHIQQAIDALPLDDARRYLHEHF